MSPERQYLQASASSSVLFSEQKQGAAEAGAVTE